MYLLTTYHTAAEGKFDNCVFFLNFRESLCHIHGLVIYKDIENPVRKNEELQKELQNLKDELNRLWQS